MRFPDLIRMTNNNHTFIQFKVNFTGRQGENIRPTVETARIINCIACPFMLNFNALGASGYMPANTLFKDML